MNDNKKSETRNDEELSFVTGGAVSEEKKIEPNDPRIPPVIEYCNKLIESMKDKPAPPGFNKSEAVSLTRKLIRYLSVETFDFVGAVNVYNNLIALLYDSGWSVFYHIKQHLKECFEALLS